MSDKIRPPWEFEEPRCAEIGTELFFSPDRDDPSWTSIQTSEYSYARKICEGCPHKFECAEWGIMYETHGMWGGLSPQQRARLRRERRIPLPVTVKDN